MRIRKDAFVFGISLVPEVRGVPNPKKYLCIWLGFLEFNVYIGKYKWKNNGGK